jgi:RDD family
MKPERWLPPLPAALQEPLRERQRWITPEPLNLAPELVGLPLATPVRRAWAMGLDLAVVGLLTSINGAWLWAGLGLVLLQLRNRPRHAPASRRQWVGWAAAALIALLALDEAHDRWTAWRTPAAATAPGRAASGEAASEDDEDAEPAAPAEAADAASAAASAVAPPSDAERIALLETQLATAKRETRRAQRALAEKPTGVREYVSRFLDDIGAGLGWGIVYFSLLPAWWGGQTVGKKLMRMRVVELTGKPITVMRSLKRYGGYAAGLATGGVGFLQLLWDPNRQGLHDKAAHTVVVDVRPGAPRQALAATVAATPPPVPAAAVPEGHEDA